MSREITTPEHSGIKNPAKVEQEIRESVVFGSEAGSENEDHLEFPMAHIDAITSRGGDQAKTPQNEDGYMIAQTPQQILVMVGDGVGGHGGGIEPAFIARASFHSFIASHYRGIITANDVTNYIGEAIHHRNLREPERKKQPMGVAAVVVAIGEHHEVDISWCGDSKLLTVRKGEKVPAGTTLMHNLGAETTEYGDDYLWNEYNHVLTRFLGNNSPKKDGGKPDRIRFLGERGDQIIVASDGLWDVVSETEVIQLAQQFSGRELHAQLFALALSRNNAAGELYNITRADGTTMPHTTQEACGDNITIAVIELK